MVSVPLRLERPIRRPSSRNQQPTPVSSPPPTISRHGIQQSACLDVVLVIFTLINGFHTEPVAASLEEVEKQCKEEYKQEQPLGVVERDAQRWRAQDDPKDEAGRHGWGAQFLGRSNVAWDNQCWVVGAISSSNNSMIALSLKKSQVELGGSPSSGHMSP